MNKRKVLSILALCLALILVIMTSVPIYNGGRRMQWVYLFRDFNRDGSPYVIFDIIFMVAAFALVALSFIMKKRAKLFITLSVVSTWISGTAMAIQTLFHTKYGIIPLICYAVLCAPVLIWNLILKNEATVYSARSVNSASTAQPQATGRNSLFAKFISPFTIKVATTASDADATTQTVAAPSVTNYSVTPANPKKDKAFKDGEVKKYYDYVIEILCKHSAENYGKNAFVNKTEIEQCAAPKFSINFDPTDKTVCKDKENKKKLMKFKKVLVLFERHNFGNGKIEIGMSEKDYIDLKKKIDALALAEITELCTKIKPEIENALKATEKQATVNLPEEVRAKFETLSNAEAERFYATLSQETDDCVQIYGRKNSIALAGFVHAIDVLNEQYGIENGCVHCAISKALTELYSGGNGALKVVLGEFVYAQLNHALNGKNAENTIPVLYSVVTRGMSYRKFKGDAVKDYQELSDDECTHIIDSLLLRSPHGIRLTPAQLRDFALKDIIDDSDIASFNAYQFEDLRDPLYRLHIVSAFIDKYIITNNYLVNSVYIMDGSLNYCYEKLCKANHSTTEAVQKEPVVDFETALANIYCALVEQSEETADEASAKRREERRTKREAAERLQQQHRQEEALSAQIEQTDIMRKQAEEQRRFNDEQAREQRRQAEEQRKLAEKQIEEQKKNAQMMACAASTCPNCRRQCGMSSYIPSGNSGCASFIKK